MFGFSEGTDYYKPVDFESNGSAVDLTGATVTVRVYPEPREGAAVSVTYTVANGGLTAGSAVDGEYTINFSAGDLTAGEYTYEATAVLASTDVAFLGRGWFRVFASHAL